jgi:hypothetical protein
MIELNKQEREKILDLSKKFITIHQEIMVVEETIKKMETRSGELINDLEDCRSSEKEFTDDLAKKYGPGKLDPTGLTWIKEEIKEQVYELSK